MIFYFTGIRLNVLEKKKVPFKRPGIVFSSMLKTTPLKGVTKNCPLGNLKGVFSE